MDFINRIKLLQIELIRENLDGFIVPSTDEFLNEYVPDHLNRIKWLTGFSGSNATAIILNDKVMFFTDGRYILQANKQFESYNEMIQIIDLKNMTPYQWIELNKFPKIGYDPFLSIAPKNNLEQIIPVENLVDRIWLDRLKPKSTYIRLHDLKYSGLGYKEKLKQITDIIKNYGADLTIITNPDSLCWLLNIRGDDIPHTPLVLSYGFIFADGKINIFTDAIASPDILEHFLPIVNFYPKDSMISHFHNLPHNSKILVDKNHIPVWFINNINIAIYGQNPCLLLKSCKNMTEQKGAIEAHIIDAIALGKFFHWLERAIIRESITEISAADYLLYLRKQDNNFVDISFHTISAFAKNGAIIHYKPTTETNLQLKLSGDLYLLDSGGQYNMGTTDVTRTIVIGEAQSEQKDFYTRVLKGHIALSNIKFPEGTTGAQLDVLARQYLWEINQDYEHGTGHGVGSFLSVHEGPCSISKYSNNIALQIGMILSNEPGYYKANNYGIRIENLMLVEKSKQDGFLEFKTLTLVPYDKKLINISMLTTTEIEWINQYHKTIFMTLSKRSNNMEFLSWLAKSTSAIM